MEAVGSLYVHRVDRDDVITSVNEEWREFVVENGAPGLASAPGRLCGRPGSCSWCRRFRTTRWIAPEEAIRELDQFGGVQPRISHGICEDCARRLLRPAAATAD